MIFLFKKIYLRCRVDHPECGAEGGGLLVLPSHAHARAARAYCPRIAVPDDEIEKSFFLFYHVRRELRNESV